MTSKLDEIDQQNIGPFERYLWAARIGRIVMAAIVVLAVAGVFSVGPASWTVIREPSGLELRYDRLVRRGGPTELSLTIPAGTVEGSDQAALWISSTYLDLVRVDGITPQPDKVVAEPDGSVFTFATAGVDEVWATFAGTPDAMGVQHGAVGLAGGEPLSFRQFFYP